MYTLEPDVVASGATCMIYKGVQDKDQLPVAVKEFRPEVSDAAIVREITILKRISHDNVIPLLEVLVDDDNTRLVFPWYARTLEDVIMNDIITMPVLLMYMRQIVRGLIAIHHRNVIHGDLKPDNILVSGTHIVIADFGLSQIDRAKAKTTEVTAIGYRAPEVLLGDKFYICSIDMWALGCIMYELLTGNGLFYMGENASKDQVIRSICAFLGSPTEETMPGWTALPGYHEDYTKMAAPTKKQATLDTNFLLSCLLYDKHKRISAQMASEHMFFNQ